MNNNRETSLIIGWKEWASLPHLNIPKIKVKIDTGAKTSALHAYDINVVKNNGKEYAKFIIHPIQKNNKIYNHCIAEIIGIKTVKSSNGLKEERFMIRSPIQIGSQIWDINITLTNRDIMHYRMLLGRNAMNSIIINPMKKYCQGKISNKQIFAKY